MLRPRPKSTLFPYTTLFRSTLNACGENGLFIRHSPAGVENSGGVAGNLVRLTTSARSEEHTSELQSPEHLVCRVRLEKKNTQPETPGWCSPRPPGSVRPALP